MSDIRNSLNNMLTHADNLKASIHETLKMLEECGELEIHGCLDNIDMQMTNLKEAMRDLNKATGNHFTKAYYTAVDRALAGSGGDMDPTT